MRVSYSMMLAWSNGDYETAISMWLGLPGYTNAAMEAGTEFHKEWEAEVKATGSLPKIFGARKLVKPEPEVKIVKKITPWLTLSGVMDLRDVPCVYEYKSGNSKAGAYAKSHQHEYYQILDPRLKIADYFVFNQHTGAVTWERVHLSKQTMLKGMTHLLTCATEMQLLLEKMGYDTSSHESRRKK
jgi:hypothetical protein